MFSFQEYTCTPMFSSPNSAVMAIMNMCLSDCITINHHFIIQYPPRSAPYTCPCICHPIYIFTSISPSIPQYTYSELPLLT